MEEVVCERGPKVAVGFQPAKAERKLSSRRRQDEQGLGGLVRRVRGARVRGDGGAGWVPGVPAPGSRLRRPALALARPLIFLTVQCPGPADTGVSQGSHERADLSTVGSPVPPPPAPHGHLSPPVESLPPPGRLLSMTPDRRAQRR